MTGVQTCALPISPEAEIPVAMALARRYDSRAGSAPVSIQQSLPVDPFAYVRRPSHQVVNFGGHQVPRVIADLSGREALTPASFFGLGYAYSVPLDKWNIADHACDYIYVGSKSIEFVRENHLYVLSIHSVNKQYPWMSKH